MNAKLAIKNETITAFGGIFQILDMIRTSGISGAIDSHLGKRGSSDAYRYSEVFESLAATYLCGGDCLEDGAHMKDTVDMMPGHRMPSPDTVGRVLRSLATDNLAYTSSKGATYEVNTADRLNDLLVNLLFTTGQLVPGQSVDVDFDHQFTPAAKYDAKYSYKGAFGYFPGVMTIDHRVVGIEERDGNDPVRFEQDATLGRMFTRLVYGHGVTIGRYRADCGSFSRDVVRCVDTFCSLFYIRASNCADRTSSFEGISDWKKVEVNDIPCEVSSIAAEGWLDNDGNALRLVVQRTAIDDKGQPGLFGVQYVHRCILTNDWETEDLDVVLLYNARGASERDFDALNNDFGWARLPFSFMNENAVFMLFMAMLRNFYLYALDRLADTVPGLERTSRIKRFMFTFLAVPAKWIRTGRRDVLKLYTRRQFYQRAFAV